MKRFILYLLPAVLIGSALGGCEKYLDARPNQSQVVPSTIGDLQALLNNTTIFNRFYPNFGEAATDDYYITPGSYAALTAAADQQVYTWQPEAQVTNGAWLSPYEAVLYANQVLASLGQIGTVPAAQAGPVRGAALFYRAYAFYEVASLFAMPYNAATASRDAGIPLRLTPDLNAKSTRASIAQTYAQVLSDLRQAVPLLPGATAFPSQPTRTAAYAMLARVSLAMGAYTAAGAYADSCMALQPPLMDFNQLNPASPNPFTRFNKETIFYAMSLGTSLLNPSRCRVDSTLYTLYANNDLRRNIYFKSNGNGSYAFKGNYDGVQSSTIFSGPATDEVYLIAAECKARAGHTADAMQTLNALLITRYASGTFSPLTAPDAGTALSLVLTERRKELIFRGTRWTDLRRLNLEAGMAQTLKRVLGQQTYTLPPGDPRYAFLIPEEVISSTGMAQNPR